jgi:hypothetical protein
VRVARGPDDGAEATSNCRASIPDEERRVDEPEIFDALRSRGVDADDPEIRAAVRTVLTHIDEVRERSGRHRARRHMEAMLHTVRYVLEHPDVGDMSSFEAEFREGNGTEPADGNGTEPPDGNETEPPHGNG